MPRFTDGNQRPYTIKGGTTVQRKPTSKGGRQSREKLLDRLVEYSLQQMFGDRHYAFHSHQAAKFDPNKPWADPNKGQPDWTGHIYGVFFHIECKVKPNRPDDHQRRWINQVNNTFGLAMYVVWDPKLDEYWIVPPGVDFSYRNTNNWIKLRKIQSGKVSTLDLTPIGHMVKSRINGIYSIIKGQS